MHKIYSRHAPGHLRDHFNELVEAIVDGGPLPEFSHNGQEISVKRLCGLLWFSGDIVSGGYPFDDLREVIEAMGGKPPKMRTYGAFARSLAGVQRD
jgi:hypothetical protein